MKYSESIALAVLGTAFGFVVYYWLAKNVIAFVTSFSVFISPVFAVFLGCLVLNEIINLQGVTGIFLILTKIVLTKVSKKIPANFK